MNMKIIKNMTMIQIKITPDIIAPNTRGPPIMYAKTTPGKIAWLIASPTSDHPFKTRKQDKNEQGKESKIVIKNALFINGN